MGLALPLAVSGIGIMPVAAMTDVCVLQAPPAPRVCREWREMTVMMAWMECRALKVTNTFWQLLLWNRPRNEH